MVRGPWMRDVTGEASHRFLGDPPAPAASADLRPDPTTQVPVPVQVVKSSGLVSGAIIGAAAAYLVPLAFEWFLARPEQPQYVDFDVDE